MSKNCKRLRLVVPLTVLALATVLAHPARADDACDSAAIGGTPHLVIGDAYSPFDSHDVTETTNLTVTNNGSAACDFAIVLTASGGEGKMRAGSEFLAYSLETPGGAALLNPPGLIDPEAGNHLDLTLGPGQAGTVSLRARLPAQQAATPPGDYADDTVSVRVYASGGDGFPALTAERAFPVAARVAAVCSMAEPDPGTLDFSDDIGADGRPTGGWRSVRVPDAACNTAAHIELEAAALTRAGTQPPSDFQTFIDLDAEATFGSVTAGLATQGGGQTVQARSPGAAPQTGGASAVDIRVRLHPGNPLAAGSYGGVLTVSLEPSP